MSSKKKKSPSQRGKWSRTKGANAERAVATLLTKDLGVTIQRKLGASRAGGSDIELDSHSYIDDRLVMRTHPGWSIEVKHHKTIKLEAWWSQTIEQADKEERRPLLVFRRDREDWQCMYLYDGEPVITDYETWMALNKDNKI